MNFFTKSSYSVAGINLLFVLTASAQPNSEKAPASSPVAAPAPAAEDSKTVESEGTTTAAAGETTPASVGPEASDSPQAKPEVIESCLAHHEGAQLARLSGGFVEALRELTACAALDCPEALRNDCLEWRREVEVVLPTVIVVAEGDSGDLAEARVLVDGVALRESLDGRPIALDPGTHIVTVALPDGTTREQRVVLSEGERGRRLEFNFKTVPVVMAPIGAPPTRTIRPVPPGVYILGATAFMGLGVGVGFGSDAWSKSRTARDLCAPLCDPDVSRAVRQRAAIADVALGVAVLSTIGAVVVYSYRPERVVPVERLAMGWVPSDTGGTFEVEGAF